MKELIERASKTVSGSKPKTDAKKSAKATPAAAQASSVKSSKPQSKLIVPTLEPVESSNVYAIGYDETKERLFIQFWGRSKSGRSYGSGPIYMYYDVPKSIWNQFYFAKSYGKFVWERIRERYRYKRLDRAGIRFKSTPEMLAKRRQKAAREAAKAAEAARAAAEAKKAKPKGKLKAPAAAASRKAVVPHVPAKKAKSGRR